MIDEECQRQINKTRAEAYATAKAHIQFPICACEFADDEETLLAPCQAHLLWKKEQIFAFLRVLRRHYDEAIKKKLFQVDRDIFITTLERGIFEAEKELGLITEEHCTYPDCNCPADAPADPNWCLRGLPRE